MSFDIPFSSGGATFKTGIISNKVTITAAVTTTSINAPTDGFVILTYLRGTTADATNVSITGSSDGRSIIPTNSTIYQYDRGIEDPSVIGLYWLGTGSSTASSVGSLSVIKGGINETVQIQRTGGASGNVEIVYETRIPE